MTNASANPIDTSAPWSEVRTADRVTRYRRSGAGPTLLLLGADAGPSPLSPDLVDELGLRFRCIVPEVPSGPNAVAWLAEFLEGLGVPDVMILAANHLCIPVIELAFRDPDRTKRIVLIPDGEPDESTSEGALTTSIGTGLIPLLVVRPGSSASDTLRMVTEFLTVIPSEARNLVAE